MRKYTKQTPEFWQYIKKAYELEPGDTVLVNYAGGEGLPAAKLQIEMIVPEKGSNKYIIEFSGGAEAVLVEPLEEFEVIQPMTPMLHGYLKEWSVRSSELHKNFFERSYHLTKELSPEERGCDLARLLRHMERCGFPNLEVLQSYKENCFKMNCFKCANLLYELLKRMEENGVF